MWNVVQDLGKANDLVSWRQLSGDISFWGLALFCVGILAWFITSYLRAFTEVEDQRWLQYTTAFTWSIGVIAFLRIDLQGFANDANRASLTYQKMLNDARGEADIVGGRPNTAWCAAMAQARESRGSASAAPRASNLLYAYHTRSIMRS
jgi:hypothetical protein